MAFPTTAPQDDATLDTDRALVQTCFPPVLDDSPAVAHIGGQTASFADIGGPGQRAAPALHRRGDLLSFLLLMLVFRSVLVPLKAAC